MVLSFWAAVPATADEAPVLPTDAATPSQPTPAAPSGGGIDQGEVTRPNPGAPTSPHARVLVFGDSISGTYRYSAEGTPSRPKAWWAHVADAAGLPASEVMLSAEGGSGLLMRGMRSVGKPCSGTTFGERLGDIARTRPDIVLVEAGRNDIKACAPGGHRPSTAAQREAAATTYFAQLAATVDRHGVARSNVYVMTAWGASHGPDQVTMANLYEAKAAAHGFSWIALPALLRPQTTDATHPNLHGTRTIAQAVMRGSDVVTAIRSHGRRHASVPSHAAVQCRGTSACRARGITVPTTVRHRIWGFAPGTSAHQVARQLTARRTVAPVLRASSARQWREAAVGDHAATAVAHARRGDVAWWSTPPAGVPRTSGHVAVVERVAADNSWVVVSERTSGGVVRAVRYAGTSLPRAYLRFASADGSPRGRISSLQARRGTVVVSGRVVDTDAPHRAVRLRLTIRQAGRTWQLTTPRGVPTGFTRGLRVAGLRPGPALVRVIALDTPKTRGKNRAITTRSLVVR